VQVEKVNIVFISIGLIGVLLFASPTINLLVKPPDGEAFSELYILGPTHNFSNLPFNVRANVNYSVYLGVVNHLGSSCYYSSLLKFTNETGSLPNVIIGAPSPISAIYDYKTILTNGETWETPLTFQVNGLTFNGGVSQISTITINGIKYPINQTSTWNTAKMGYYYNLFVELWVFNSTLETSNYNNRFVDLYLNLTQ
jgi:hypothetical protein